MTVRRDGGEEAAATTGGLSLLEVSLGQHTPYPDWVVQTRCETPGAAGTQQWAGSAGAAHRAPPWGVEDTCWGNYLLLCGQIYWDC